MISKCVGDNFTKLQIHTVRSETHRNGAFVFSWEWATRMVLAQKVNYTSTYNETHRALPLLQFEMSPVLTWL